VDVYTRRKIKDALGRFLIALIGLVALFPLFHIFFSIAYNGVKVIAASGIVEFLTGIPNPTNPRSPGGIGPALLGSIVLAVVATAIAIPIALNAAIFVSEFRGSPASRFTLLLSLLLVEFPTILVGLFVYAVVVEPLKGFSLLAGSIALALVMLPYVVAQASEALRQIPRDLREAAYSLGLSRLKTVYRLMLGMARRGILVGVLIGLAKALGETAPLLFTVYGAFNTYPQTILDPGAAIPLLIYIYAQQPGEGYRELAWGAAFILLVMVTSIVLVAKKLVQRVHL